MKKLVQTSAALLVVILSVLTCQPPLENAATPNVIASAETETPNTTLDVVETHVVPEPRPRRVLVVGDSEACAVAAYVSAAARDHGDVAFVECKASTTIQYWSTDRLIAALDSHPNIDSVIVFLGTNHYLDRVAPPVKHILDVIEARRLKCVWVGNTAVGGRSHRINDLLHDAVTPVCRYFDAEAFDLKLYDGVHPTRGSAERWIKGIWSVLPEASPIDE